MGRKENVLTMPLPFQELRRIEVKLLAQELKIDCNQNFAARLIAKAIGDSRIPARIKIGLDIGNGPGQMPCNICTNLQPFNPALEAKPRAFRWGPVLSDQSEASIWIMNSGPHIQYTRSSDVEIT